MRFRNYINEAKKLEFTVFTPAEKFIGCYISVGRDLNDLPKGFYRNYGAESGGTNIFVSKGTKIKLVQLLNPWAAIRKEGKSFQVEISKTDLESLGKSKKGISPIIGRLAVSNNAEALERTVIIAAEHFMQHNKNITFIEMMEIMDNQPDYRAGSGFRKEIYNNAIKSTKLIQKLVSSKKYSFERQQENHSKILYILAKKYNKNAKKPDNWNPADIWLFSDKAISSLNKIQEYLDNYVNASRIKTFFEADTKNNEYALALNYFIAQGIQSKDILPISLKKPTNPILKMYLLNKFNPANLPEIRNVDTIAVTAFTVGTSNFTSFEIGTNHPQKLAVKFQLQSNCGWQHRVRNNSAGHAEGSYLDTKEWKNYLIQKGIKIYGCQPGYTKIPTEKVALRKLYDYFYNFMSKNPLYVKNAFNKIDKNSFFEINYAAGETGSKGDKKEPSIEMIKRFIFHGSWQETIAIYGDEVVRTAIGIAIKSDHDQASSGPHYIIK